jgi:hypothetical protein
METLLGSILILGAIVLGFLVLAFVWGFWQEYGVFLLNVGAFLGGIWLIHYAISTESKGWGTFGIICTVVGGFNVWDIFNEGGWRVLLQLIGTIIIILGLLGAFIISIGYLIKLIRDDGVTIKVHVVHVVHVGRMPEGRSAVW